MTKLEEMLSSRVKAKRPSEKMTSLAQTSSQGLRSGFAGVFGVGELDPTSKEQLRLLLLENEPEMGASVEKDLEQLISITAEVKAINRQAALLHGERIQKAQTLLKKYREGAFTSWLIATYGNRQTPYNFLQYFEFYQGLPAPLQTRIEEMPLQAVYTLASRKGNDQTKRSLIANYNGETKNQLLSLIRETFPLAEGDRRKRDIGETAIASLESVFTMISQKKGKLPKTQCRIIREWLDEIRSLVE